MQKRYIYLISLLVIQTTAQTHSMSTLIRTIITTFKKTLSCPLKTSKAIPQITVHNHIKHNLKNPLDNAKIITAFHSLTQRTSSEIQFFKEHDNSIIASVSNTRPEIIINEKLIEELPPSRTVRVLLHEFRHIQQFKQLNDQEQAILKKESANSPYRPTIVPSLQKFYNSNVLAEIQKKLTPSSSLFNPFWSHQEYDADYFAAEKISCPVCLKIIQSQSTPSYLLDLPIGDNKSVFGYFGFEDYIPFIQATNQNACCPAHTKRLNDNEHNEILDNLETNLTQIKDLLWDPEIENLAQKNSLTGEDLEKRLAEKEIKYKELYQKIVKLDHQSGNILQHIPNFSCDRINSMQHQQSLWKTILKHEQERKEIKLLSEGSNTKRK